MSTLYLSVVVAAWVLAVGIGALATAVLWRAPMRPMPSPKTLLVIRLGFLATLSFGAVCVLQSVVPMLGLVLPTRTMNGTVSRVFTEPYGRKQSRGPLAGYIVVNGMTFLTNNDHAPDPIVGDVVRFDYHEGENEIVALQVLRHIR